MIRFFQTPQKTVIATEVDHVLNEQEIKELNWLYGEAELLDADSLDGFFVGLTPTVSTGSSLAHVARW